MGIPVLILGESGSGKSASLRNFSKDNVGVINVAGKPLPFRSEIKPYNLNRESKKQKLNRYYLLYNVMKKAKVKSIVIDDSQYLIAFDSFEKANIKNYDKFTDMAVNFEQLIEFCIDVLDEDKIIYFLHHTETSDTGKVKAKTIGKMLDNQLTVEGLFSIVLLCTCDKTGHYFITQSDGTTTAKSPMGMFEYHIDNDLKAVDDIIRNYYNLKETTSL